MERNGYETDGLQSMDTDSFQIFTWLSLFVGILGLASESRRQKDEEFSKVSLLLQSVYKYYMGSSLLSNRLLN